jgi:large subunit ribosomal protein L15
MSLSLHTIKPKKGSRKASKRVGRGLGSKGTYSGRGVKGQGARSGVTGLQLKGFRTVMLATPKSRGFKSLESKPSVVNVGDLNKAFSDGAKVTPKGLLQRGLVTNADKIKILGDGALAVKLTVTGCLVSAGAKAKIEKAGGSVIADAE